MENWIFISTIILLLSVWLWLHHRSKSDLSHEHKSIPIAKPHVKTYHATSIHPCSKACESVNSLKEKRFLLSEVAALPVQGCTNPNCDCTYIHHEDRRNGDDRRVPSITMENVFSANEHRTTKVERRKQSLA